VLWLLVVTPFLWLPILSRHSPAFLFFPTKTPGFLRGLLPVQAPFIGQGSRLHFGPLPLRQPHGGTGWRSVHKLMVLIGEL